MNLRHSEFYTSFDNHKFNPKTLNTIIVGVYVKNNYEYTFQNENDTINLRYKRNDDLNIKINSKNILDDLIYQHKLNNDYFYLNHYTIK